tara:strand:- start:12266 stop:12448 length:183 start_codon:yes stop_codon:yes gene_type:complete
MAEEKDTKVDLDAVHTAILINAFEILLEINENEEEVKPVVQNIADVTCNHLQYWKDTGQI